MIASVRGEVLDIALDHVVIEACGVGYKVMATPSTLATLRRGSEARLITAMIVREDSQTLYGFADTEARDLFLTLLGVSGVGPKIALATLAVYDAPSLRQALADGDVTALTRVPGIGKRGAERLVLELRDKIGPAHAAAGAVALNGHSAPSWKRLSALALRSSRPKRPPTRCWPTSPTPAQPVRCARRCPCWARSNGSIRERRA
jgi:Holliday junction DNA helicase RuvA